MAPSAAPPSPQEIKRKLSVHSVVKSPPVSSSLSGNESDSDSAVSPESAGIVPAASNIGQAMAATGQPPLTSIAERRDGSDSEEEDEEEEGGWKTATNTGSPLQHGTVEEVIKSGYLWKKGERRKTWKKRWFVLRPQHLAYYKTAAEYQLLRLLELSDVHSCTQVTLKRHENTFGLVSPVRTYYLQAKTAKDVQEWVAAIEQARMGRSTNPASQPPISIPLPGSPLQPAPLTPPPPSFPPAFHTATSSESEDAYPIDPRMVASPLPPSPTRNTTKDPGKAVLSGYLMKCGSKRRNWRKRWFVLTGEKLVYYASHMDAKPHRQFAFTDILDALEYDLHEGRHQSSSPPSTQPPEAEDHSATHTFKIVTTKRTLLLCAPGEEEEIKWLGAIRALIARRSGAGVVPGETSKAASGLGSNLPGSSLQATSPTDGSAPSSGLASGGSGGLKAKVRRLSASKGSTLGGGFDVVAGTVTTHEKEKTT